MVTSTAAEPLRLIVGLGNPGPQYRNTRHNAGADFVEALAQHLNAPLTANARHHGRLGEARVEDRKIRLLIPQTFMNCSGKSVASLAGFYRIPPPAMLVAHDELDLPPGTARLKFAGGHGGHQGLADIFAALGNRRDCHRLRLGIGHPGAAQQVVGYVLQKAPPTERQALAASIDRALQIMPDCLHGRWQTAMQTLHSQTSP